MRRSKRSGGSSQMSTGRPTNSATLVEVRGDVETVVAAAAYVEDHGFTPFDALHLVESDGDRIVSSDSTYDGFAPRRDIASAPEE